MFSDESEVVVNSLFEDSRGRVWLGTVRHGLYYWQSGQLLKMPDSVLDSRIIHAIAEDTHGQLWLGTHAGLLCYDADLRNKAEVLPEYEVRCLLPDRSGALWVGTTGSGLARMRNGGFEYLTKADGLTADTIVTLAQDAEENVWIGTPEGLNQLTDIKLQTCSTKDGFPLESALSVSSPPRGGLWIGTEQGAVYWKDGQATTYSTTNGLQSPYVKRVLEATNGEVYVISGRNDIEVLAGGKVVARHVTTNMPVAMVEDAQGVVVSVAGDLFRVNRERLTPFAFQQDAKPELYWIMNLAIGRDGDLWVASANGVCRIKGGRFQQWTQKDGLADSTARWVYEEADGTVWIGLGTGIARLKNGKLSNLRQSDGLPDVNIYSVTPDDYGRLWVDSLGGIFRLNKQNVDDYFSGRTLRLDVVAYTTPEAVKQGDKQSQESTAGRTSDGRIWFPGPKGVVIVDPSHVPVNPVAPAVQLRSVSAGGKKLDRSKPIVLPAGQQNLEFSYTAYSYTSPRQVRFRYQLEGHDADWIETEERRLATYANLTPGRYTFRVTACNADGLWSKNGDVVELQLLPHFYQTRWFVALELVSGVTALLAIYGWRVRHLRRKQRQLQVAQHILEERVAMRTAELAQSNAALVNEIEERKRLQQEADRVHEVLQAASRQAGQAEVASSVLHNVGNVLNSVNVSAGILSERVRKLRVSNLTRAAQLLEAQATDPARFLADDSKGRQLPQYLHELARYLGAEQETLLAELKGLSENVDHIKEIVAMQQAHARLSGVWERIAPQELVEGALKMQSDSLRQHAVTVTREFEAVPVVVTDKHKVLQILVNLLRNARQACDEGGVPEKHVLLRLRKIAEGKVAIEITDNGVGIAPESLTRIFSHGFTTRKGGHGFGLHSAALAAGELGGTLSAQSAGLGFGATFILELPLAPTGASTAQPDRAQDKF